MDSWSGKWLGVDILAEAKPFMSPYSYGLGNPVRFSDPSGMIEEDQDGLMSVSLSESGGSRLSGYVLDAANFENDETSENENPLNEQGLFKIRRH